MRPPIIAALALILAPAPARAQMTVVVDGVAQEIPAGFSRTVTTSGGRTRVADAPWSGVAAPYAASITTVEETVEDGRGRVVSRTVTTRITPQAAIHAEPVRVVVQQAYAPQPQYAPAYAAPAYAPAAVAPSDRAADADPIDLDGVGTAAPRIMRVRREGWSGHFVAAVRINGVKLRAIVDTGAAYTILSADDARRSGADRMVEREEIAAGIGGWTKVGVARLDSIEIGGQRLGRVVARIGQPGIPYTLLGQTEIARLGRIVIEDGVMTIIPRGIEVASR